MLLSVKIKHMIFYWSKINNSILIFIFIFCFENRCGRDNLLFPLIILNIQVHLQEIQSKQLQTSVFLSLNDGLTLNTSFTQNLQSLVRISSNSWAVISFGRPVKYNVWSDVLFFIGIVKLIGLPSNNRYFWFWRTLSQSSAFRKWIKQERGRKSIWQEFNATFSFWYFYCWYEYYEMHFFKIAVWAYTIMII